MRANLPRRVYWDSCVFLGLISAEAAKITVTEAVWQEAKEGKTDIFTSALTFAEVIRAKCEGKTKPLPVEQDAPIVEFLSQKWIKRVLLDEALANKARLLLRKYNECRKPTDGIHLATALNFDVDEMHTWDGSDLLNLDGKVQKKNGTFLTICRPREIVPARPLPAGPAIPLELDLGDQ